MPRLALAPCLALLGSLLPAQASRPTHWAYRPIGRPEPPATRDAAWPRNPIDRFVLARLEHEGLAPSREARRETLLRRASLDLTGLPPTPAEVRAYAEDTRDDAWERVVDRLLASPAYGERMAQLWLDLARYADSKGYEKDAGRQIWRWRDWVVGAFAEDLPFDRFTVLQLAGDLLEDATDATRLPTAFHRNTMTNDEGGTDDEEFRVAAVVDRVNTTMQVWTASTLACAQCHDHKHDPFSQREYFALYAFFDNTADADREDDAPLLELPTPEQLATRARLATVKASLEQMLVQQLPELRGAERDKAPELESLRVAIAHAQKQIQTLPVATVPVLLELRGAARRTTHLLRKGSYLAPGPAVEPGTPRVLPPLPDGAARDRLALARWLVSEANPLTARVLANRLWEMLFGTGIVETAEDFGTQGEPPSHPELLDWLAREVVRQGWSVKRALRLLVTSATYRQDSALTKELLERDPKNRWLARGPRFRLPAETVRDQALAVAGLLSRRAGGPPVMPPQPEGFWNVPYDGLRWKDADGEDRYRRALYTFWRRSTPYPSLVTFDAPDRMLCTSRRLRTNTPLQALVTLNDPAFVEAALALARRIAAEPSGDVEMRAAWAFELCTARAPGERERQRLVSLYGDELARADAAAAERLARAKGDPRAKELAAWFVVANVLLNLDEVLTKG